MLAKKINSKKHRKTSVIGVLSQRNPNLEWNSCKWCYSIAVIFKPLLLHNFTSKYTEKNIDEPEDFDLKWIQ